MQAAWWVATAASFVAAAAALADRARTRRRDLAKVGWVPWPLILVLSIGVAAVAAALALGG